MAHKRGERVIEATFDGHAREEGNAVGYETIAASGPHATTLHWISNDGAMSEGDLLLLDAGVEVESLYTADLTRTLPIGGTFSPVQRRVYDVVLEAADAAFAAARPGAKFRDAHDAAMKVIEARLREWGIVPASDDPEAGLFRRWMVHSTSHHLGLDVHDCASVKRDAYLDGEFDPAWSSPSNPGSTSRRTTSPSPRSSGASGYASKTTFWSPRTGWRTCRGPCRVAPRTLRSGCGRWAPDRGESLGDASD